MSASATTLALPQLAEAEKGPQTRGKLVCDSNQGTEPRSSAEKDEAREDEDWLEDPAHPRNWPSGKKWVNMAIVSEFLCCF